MSMDHKIGRFILASSSPRRKQLLSEAGYEFETVDPPIDEPASPVRALNPSEVAEALAYFKARSVADGRPDAMILGADTICAVGDEILGKPADADDARRMLRTLSSTPHHVITGIALLGPGVRMITSDRTRIHMRPLSETELEDYIASGEWEGKAGAYAIQETADRFVTNVDGSFTNVVGLPVELVRWAVEQLHNNRSAYTRA